MMLSGKQRTPSKVWLMLTDRCNLSCTYCYNKRRRDKEMSWETLMKSMDFIFKTTQPDTDIMLWGGEPFLAWPTMKKLLAHYPLQKFGTCTNGTTITREIIDTIKARGNFVTVLSIDGTKESQEKGRPGSWDKLGNVKMFTELSDITVHVVAYDIPKLYDNVLYIRDLGFKDIIVTAAHGVEYSQSDINLYKETIVRLLEEQKKGNVNMVGWGHYKTIRDGELSQDKFCGAGVIMYAITVDGDIYPCDAFYGSQAYKMGNVDDGFDGDVRKIFEDIFHNRVKINGGCAECIYDGGCGGRMCIHENYVKNGSIYTPVTTTCQMLQAERCVVAETHGKYTETYYGDRANVTK
jgi:uncharacterized protein